MRYQPLAAFTLVVCVIALAPAAHARTLTFDDVPSGTTLYYSPLYRNDYRVSFGFDFQATDHTSALWGYPHSGTNVLTVTRAYSGYNPRIGFGYFTPHSVDFDTVRSVGAYFSTDAGAMVKMTVFRDVGSWNLEPVTSVVIGGVGVSWDNACIEVSLPETPFCSLEFEGVNSPDDLLGFCLDDMTITYVPEPSSLAGFVVAFAGFAGAALRGRCRRSG